MCSKVYNARSSNDLVIVEILAREHYVPREDSSFSCFSELEFSCVGKEYKQVVYDSFSRICLQVQFENGVCVVFCSEASSLRLFEEFLNF